MKILQVNNHHRIIGGSDTVYFNTGELLAERGHTVHWFAGKSEQDRPSPDSDYFPDAVNMQRPRLSDLPRYIRNHAARREIVRLLRIRGRIDVAHLHIYYGRLTPSILNPLRAKGVPVVQSLHEYKLACPIYTMTRDGAICDACVTGSTTNLLRYRCKEGSLAKSAVVFTEYHAARLQGDVSKIDRFICVSDFQRRLMLRAGIPDVKLTTLHNFVNSDALAPTEPVANSGDLVYFGRIERLKGLPTLLDAVANVGASLKIAGTGSWTDDMRTRIADMPNVEYLGFVLGDPLRRLIAGAQAVIVPSEWYENCPMSVLEAKAVGTPVIGARIGGIPELVRDNVDGFLFNPGDAADLARAIRALKSADRGKLGDAARADVQARFSPDAHYKNLMKIYAGVGAS